MTMRDPIKAVESLDELNKQAQDMTDYLRAESNQIRVEWEGLKEAGGIREDHAATLLLRLRPHLDRLAHFCSNVETQIGIMHDDPFQRKG
jgi:hypothetical protein